MATADPNAHFNMKGIVKIPAILLMTVNNNAMAVLPPTACVMAMPLERVVGAQQKIARPTRRPWGSMGRLRHKGAINAVKPSIVARPKLSAPVAETANHHHQRLSVVTYTRKNDTSFKAEQDMS